MQMIRLSDLSKASIDYIREYQKNRGNCEVLVEVPNTKGTDIEALKLLNPSNIKIRIEGGYDSDVLKNLRHTTFKNGETGEYFFDAVIYSVPEVYRLVSAFNSIENHPIIKTGTELEKAAYLYDKIRKNVRYDPKFEQKSSYDIRSLRGFLTKETVCAGYAMMYKELCDRNKIKCSYTSGNGHAWNIININGKNYPVDLTWDAGSLRRGNYNLNYFGKCDSAFINEHIPHDFEKITDYKNNLCSLSDTEIKRIKNVLDRFNPESTNCEIVPTKNGGIRTIMQIMTENNNDKNFLYFCAETDMNGKKILEGLFSTNADLPKYIRALNFNHKVPVSYTEGIKEIFSYDNLLNSLKTGNIHLGDLNKVGDKYVKSTNRKMSIPVITYKLSDGSTCLVFKNSDIPNSSLASYKICKQVRKDKVFAGNLISESDLRTLSDQKIIDTIFSNEKIKEALGTRSGYIGKIRNTKTILNPLYEIKGKLANTLSNELKLSNSYEKEFPSFADIIQISNNYKFSLNSLGQKQITDNKTNKEVKDLKKIEQIIYSVAWTNSLNKAGVSLTSKECERLYQLTIKEFINHLNKYGCINDNELIYSCEKNGYKVWANVLRALLNSDEKKIFIEEYIGVRTTQKENNNKKIN